MYKKVKKILTLGLIVSIIATQALFMSTAFAEEAAESPRLSGTDRYKTAVKISQEGWADGAEAVILATGENFPDALAAGPLAKKLDAPIILTNSGSLNADALAEIKRLEVSKVIIVGGDKAVSPAIEEALDSELNTEETVVEIDRIKGATRYETAAKIAEEIGTSTKVAIATGSGFADALSISPIAANLEMPILLTQKDKLSDEAKAYMKDKEFENVYVVGGKNAVSDEAIEGLGAIRLSGANRYETNVKVMDEFKDSLNFEKIFVAVGDGPRKNEFADALAGSVLAAKNSAPVVLVYKTVSDEVKGFLSPEVVKTATIIAIGGKTAVPESIITELKRNHAPVVKNAIAPVLLVVNGDTVALDLAEVFEDADKDELTFTVESSDDAVASAEIADGSLELSSVAVGEAEVTLTAEDGRGGSESLEVVVAARNHVIGDNANKFVKAQDFGVMNFSGVKGYSVGFNLVSKTAEDLQAVVVSLYKDDTLLAVNVNKPALLEEYGDASQLSSPFDIHGDYSDEYWFNGEWLGEATDVPNRAEIVIMDENNLYVVENTTLTGDVDGLFTTVVKEDRKEGTTDLAENKIGFDVKVQVNALRGKIDFMVKPDSEAANVKLNFVDAAKGANSDSFVFGGYNVESETAYPGSNGEVVVKDGWYVLSVDADKYSDEFGVLAIVEAKGAGSYIPNVYAAEGVDFGTIDWNYYGSYVRVNKDGSEPKAPVVALTDRVEGQEGTIGFDVKVEKNDATNMIELMVKPDEKPVYVKLNVIDKYYGAGNPNSKFVFAGLDTRDGSAYAGTTQGYRVAQKDGWYILSVPADKYSSEIGVIAIVEAQGAGSYLPNTYAGADFGSIDWNFYGDYVHVNLGE